MSFITNLGKSLASILPRKEPITIEQPNAKLSALQEKITKLKDALRNPIVSRIFIETKGRVINEIDAQATECKTHLESLNGSYFEDPRALLKSAWDKLVQKVQTALGMQISTRGELDVASTRLDASAETPEIKAAKSSIKAYKRLETKRNNLEKQLQEFTTLEKSGTRSIDQSLLEKKQVLEKRHDKLCGQYFQDPLSLLDQAWVRFQEELAKFNPFAPSVEDCKEAYDTLEEERKQIEGELYLIQQQIAAAPSAEHTYDKLTEVAIREEIAALENEMRTIDNEDSEEKSNIDWKRTTLAISAAVTGFLSLRGLR